MDGKGKLSLRVGNVISAPGRDRPAAGKPCEASPASEERLAAEKRRGEVECHRRHCPGSPPRRPSGSVFPGLPPACGPVAGRFTRATA
jgi:hypothetical protein